MVIYDYDKMKFTPTEELLLDLLVARMRLGENVWTVGTNVRPTLVKLRERGLVNFKDAPVENCQLAWLTNDGKALLLANHYNDQLDSKKVQRHSEKLRKEAKAIRKSQLKKDKSES